MLPHPGHSQNGVALRNRSLSLRQVQSDVDRPLRFGCRGPVVLGVQSMHLDPDPINSPQPRHGLCIQNSTLRVNPACRPLLFGTGAVALLFMTYFSVWLNTGERCKRGKPIQKRTATTDFANADPLVEVETRCCRACEAED